MERSLIDDLFQNGRLEELIEQLEQAISDDYEEYAMLKLGQAYLLENDEKKAKKIVRRLKMLFPDGEYAREEEELLEAVSKGTIHDYIEKYCSLEVKPQFVCDNVNEPTTNLNLASIVQQAKIRGKKQNKIPASIKE